jgi:hypothetical protein
VLGFRPIVLKDGPQVQEQLGEILAHFRSVFAATDVPKLTVAEGRGRDGDLLDAARHAVGPEVTCRHELMAAIKGLERTCVVWRTSSTWAIDEGAAELTHTVLTRAMSLAVIVLDEENTREDVLRAVAALRPDRILPWDEAAEMAWERLVRRLPRQSPAIATGV